MLSSESRHGRRILGTVAHGGDLFDAVRELCRDHGIRAGELRATGILVTATLGTFDLEARAPRALRELAGGLELVSLTGSIAEQQGALTITARAVLVDGATGALCGGELRAATAHAVELVIEAFDDLVLERGDHPELAVAMWAGATATASKPAVQAAAPVAIERERTGQAAVVPPPPRPNGGAIAPVRQASATWADVARASPAPAAATPEQDDVALAAGDVVIHPRFQRCVVHRVEGGGDFVQVQLRNGRVVRLSLEVMRLSPSGVENGQRIFTATIL